MIDASLRPARTTTRFNVLHIYTPDKGQDEKTKLVPFATEATTPVEIARAAFHALGREFTENVLNELLALVQSGDIEGDTFDFTINGRKGDSYFEIENAEFAFANRLERLEAMPIFGNAGDDAPLFALVDEIVRDPQSRLDECYAAFRKSDEATGDTRGEFTPEAIAEYLAFTTEEEAPAPEPVVEGGRAIAFIGGRIIAPKVEARPADELFVISAISRQSIAEDLTACLEFCRSEGVTILKEEVVAVAPSMLSADLCSRYAAALGKLGEEVEDSNLDEQMVAEQELQFNALEWLGLVRREAMTN